MGFLHVLTVIWLRFLVGAALAGHLVLGFIVGNATNAPPSISFVALSQHQSQASHATSTPLSPAASPIKLSSTSPISDTKKTSSAPAPKPVSVLVPEVTPSAFPQPTITQGQADAQTRAALVNILCTTGAGGYFNPISGSGVIIDTRGIILTNAHVGQYFLLHDYPTQNNVECVVRMGSPAQAKYTATLLYLPPAWIDANANQVGQSNATGTGEDDYSFLRITSTTSGSPLPSSFPALTMTLDDPPQGEPLLLAAYPAQLLDGNIIQTGLYITSTVTTVQQLFSFHSTSTVDLISLGGTIVSQEGSSGGAVVRLLDGAITGIIDTETTGTTTANRDLQAITVGYINRSLASEGQGGIATLLTGDLTQKSADFNTTIAPKETSELTAVLEKE
jgi:hypothetical protein